MAKIDIGENDTISRNELGRRRVFEARGILISGSTKTSKLPSSVFAKALREIKQVLACSFSKAINPPIKRAVVTGISVNRNYMQILPKYVEISNIVTNYQCEHERARIMNRNPRGL